MSFKISSLDKLIELLSRLPGLGEKTAQRLAFHLLKSKEFMGQLSAILVEVRDNVRHCTHCFNYTDQDICAICNDQNREKEMVCVVEDPSDILRIEGAMHFKGLYHVLQGVLSPLDGVGPDQIRLQELLDRVANEGVREVILALDADLEGDATSLYLTKIIKPAGVKVTRIAHGVPIGGNLEYVDFRTLSRALENRVEL